MAAPSEPQFLIIAPRPAHVSHHDGRDGGEYGDEYRADGTADFADDKRREVTMRHIVRLHIKNFQNHRDTDIRLEEGINLITGSSDSGKSAILRALNAVLHNKWPSGHSHVRKGASQSEITVVFSDNTAVTRVKSKTRNSVTVTKLPPADAVSDMGQALEAVATTYDRFGTDLPPEFVAALGSPPVYDDENGVPRGISYAEQLEPYFLVSLGPTALPRILSKLTGINAMEQAVQMLDTDEREARGRVDDHARHVLNYVTELKPYAALDERLSALADLKARRDAIQAGGDGIARGRALLDRLKGNECRRADLTEERDAARKLCTDAIKARLQRAETLRVSIADVRALQVKNAAIVGKRDALTEERTRYQKAYNGFVAERETLISDLRACGWLCAACGRPRPPQPAPPQTEAQNGSIDQPKDNEPKGAIPA